VSATFRGDIQQAAENFAAAMRRRDRDAADALTRSYAEIRARLAAQYADLTEEIARRGMSGKAVGNALRNRFSRVATLLRQADEELLAWAAEASDTIRAEQAKAVAQAQADAEALARAGMGQPPPGITATFNRLPSSAVADLVGVLADGTPLADLLDAYGAVASGEIKDALITGLARGLHPFEIARNVRGAMDGNAVRALTVARTETLRAYRESSLRFFKANSDIVTGWIWWSARDKTTCPVCWAEHGSKHSLDEHFGSHPNCRCTQLPITKTWAELGFGDVPGDAPLDVPTGPELFAALSPQMQRAILGRAKYAAYKAGDLDLADVVKVTRDPRWGLTRSERSLRDILAT
jgi:SPP1 gp7 family putative phage head morphogenesis protein